MNPDPAPYLNALRLIEKFGRDLAAHIRKSGMSPDGIDGATVAIGAMINATEMHRAVLEAAAQERLN